MDFQSVVEAVSRLSVKFAITPMALAALQTQPLVTDSPPVRIRRPAEGVNVSGIEAEFFDFLGRIAVRQRHSGRYGRSSRNCNERSFVE